MTVDFVSIGWQNMQIYNRILSSFMLSDAQILWDLSPIFYDKLCISQVRVSIYLSFYHSHHEHHVPVYDKGL